MLVDAQAPLEKQDLTIARTVVSNRAGVLILGVNKCDLLDNRASALSLGTRPVADLVAPGQGSPG